MDIQLIEYLRAVAHRCIALARDCPHAQTSHALEELAAEFMAKALEMQGGLGHADRIA